MRKFILIIMFLALFIMIGGVILSYSVPENARLNVVVLTVSGTASVIWFLVGILIGLRINRGRRVKIPEEFKKYAE